MFEDAPSGRYKVAGFNGNLCNVTQIGKIRARFDCTDGTTAALRFDRVLVVPTAKSTLISAKALAKDNDAKVWISAHGSGVEVPDGRIIKLADHSGLDWLIPRTIDTALSANTNVNDTKVDDIRHIDDTKVADASIDNASSTTRPPARTAASITSATRPHEQIVRAGPGEGCLPDRSYSPDPSGNVTVSLDFEAASPATTDSDPHLAPSLMDLHRRLGHISLDRLAKYASALGIQLSSRQRDDCLACLRGKMQKKQSSKMPSKDARQRPLWSLIYQDIAGPINPPSVYGYQYIVALREDRSGYIWLRFLRAKSELPAVMDKWLALHPRTEVVRMDRDSNNTSHRILSIFAARGVRPEYRPTDMEGKMGFLETVWRWLTRCAIACLIAANMARLLY